MKRSRVLGAIALAALVLVGLSFARARATGDVPTVHEAHMEMTVHALEQPGDRARADAILAAARSVMAQYPTVDAAEKAGFAKFLPKIPLPIEHYTSRANALQALIGPFDPLHPTSLIFKRSGTTLTLVGVMYTASNRLDRDQLDARVPLSFGTWHRHVDFCVPPAGTPRSELLAPAARFGLEGSIVTADECKAAGGVFIPRVFSWMVHVWPNEKTEDKIWAVDAGMMGSEMARGMEGPGDMAHVAFNGLPIPLAKLPSAEVAAGDPVHGATVFTQNCASCHGVGARNGPDAPALAGSGLAAGQVAFMVRNPQAIDPKSEMPLISLDERDLADVAAYVASLKE